MKILLEETARFVSLFNALIHEQRKKSFWRKLRRMRVLFRPRLKCSRVSLSRR